MKDKSIRPFLIGFLLSATGVVLLLYWRRQMARMQAPGVVLLGRKESEAALQSNVDIVGEVTNSVAESLAGALSGMRARPVAQRRVDDLTRVTGIGPVYARRLNEAGIATFAALAATPVEELAAIVHLQEWQAAYPGDWITQAAALAAGV